MNLVSTVRACT